MKAVAAGAQVLDGEAARRAGAALSRAPRAVEPFDPAEAAARLSGVFGEAA